MELAQQRIAHCKQDVIPDGDASSASHSSSAARPSTPTEHSDTEQGYRNMQSSSGSDSDQGSYPQVASEENDLHIADHIDAAMTEDLSPSMSRNDGAVLSRSVVGARMDPIIASPARESRMTGMAAASSLQMRPPYYAEHSLFGSPSITADFFDSKDSGHYHSDGHHAVHRSYSTPVLQDVSLMNTLSLTNGRQQDIGSSLQFQDALFVQQALSDSHHDNSHIASFQKEEELLKSLQHSMHRENHPQSGVSSMGCEISSTALLQVVPQTSSPSKAATLSINSNHRGTCTPWMHPTALGDESEKKESTVSSGKTEGDGVEDDLDDSDESCEPTRHLWIGNLGTRTPRTILKAMFEKHGIVDDVVTFPGRMYAFVNYRSTEEAIAAFAAFQDRVIPELTGDRRLLLKYRPAKKATAHLRALGLVDEDGASVALPGEGAGGLIDDADGILGGSGIVRMSDLDRDGNSSEPSPRIWLGNIAPTATSKSLHVVLGRFGPLTDAAVFPARIGPLGYAFVKFENLTDAVRAFDALNNTIVPTLSGSKQLKMRYKPATDGPGAREDGLEGSKASSVPSRHLWLGNVTQKPSEDIVLQIFARYGSVDSVRVFPAKAYAFVNFAEVSAAAAAVNELDGTSVPALTGVKPLVMRYQQEAMPMLPKGMMPVSSNPSMPRVHSESALALAASLNQLMPHAAALLDVNGGGQVSNPSASIHRSPSVGLLGLSAISHPQHRSQQPLTAGNRLSEHGLHLQSTCFGLNPLPQQQQLDSLATAAVSAQHDHSASSSNSSAMNTPTTAPMLGLPRMPNASPAIHGGTIGASASATQLSAVLNNLTALQHAQSGGFPTTTTVTTASDIARLTSMLANQSIASTTPSPVASFSVGGTVGSPAISSSRGSNLMCPLSGQIMIDPVVAADGITYNRSAILEWMSVKYVFSSFFS